MDKTEALSRVFGFETFRAGQEPVVDALLAGRDALAVMPTGAGKSLCYQLPAVVERDGLTLVVSPLIALMDDQVRGLRLQDIAAAAMHSGHSSAENANTLRAAVAGELRLLYVSPERVTLDGVLDHLQHAPVRRVVVDEAHCISQWGFSFRPEYLALPRLRGVFPGAAFAAFTATADAVTRDEIVARLLARDAEVFVFGFDRPNIEIRIAEKTNPKRQLLAFMADRRGQSGIVYCLSRKAVDEMAALLTAEGFRALPYHAGMDSETRAANQDWFATESGVVMVATIAFGMGIDKPDVRFVFHTDVPGSIEAYYQEIGRAGRDGQPAVAQMLHGLDDIRTRRRFIEESGANEEKCRVDHQRLNALLGLCETTECRRRSLLAAFDEVLEADCGRCDICLEPPVVIDGSVAAQKLMSAMLRTGCRFGVGHLIDVLLGAATENVRKFGHEALPTFGIGVEFKREGWRSVARQLLAMGVIDLDMAGWGAPRPTERGRRVLKGGETVSIRRPDERRSTQRKSRSAMPPPDVAGADSQVLVRLKTLRLAIAREQGVPAYVVFNDRTLIGMASSLPRTLGAMAEVHGVGRAKLEKFGARFLETLNAEM
ncbi:MAG: DNA helicase RecQ [Alphaproteobacteria bacterium]|nr:DNA helicase RecQ [Alphaproteobacteria bacterium]